MYAHIFMTSYAGSPFYIHHILRDTKPMMRMFTCNYIHIYIRTYKQTYLVATILGFARYREGQSLAKDGSLCACVYVCMYVCMYVYIYIYIYIYIYTAFERECVSHVLWLANLYTRDKQTQACTYAHTHTHACMDTHQS